MPTPSAYPKHRQWNRRRAIIPAAPPAPAQAHITGIERLGQTVLRFTFDTVIVDTGACGDLRVSDLGPSASTQTGDYTLEAVYPEMVNGDTWTAHAIDNEPIFANGETLADDGGIVPVWA
ncbi:MAG TPA: hypothetical protein VFE58_05655 [Tepidisphaeraceae bacterium]|jgi:hypothetical protein|nr:hypothetical protein [Tepidisphaeraceae bacterium]